MDESSWILLEPVPCGCVVVDVALVAPIWR